jgi:hypothetical protein
MRDDAPGETLKHFRSLAAAVRANLLDPTRRIEAIMDRDTFRRLAKDVAAVTGIDGWSAFASMETPIVSDRTETGMQVDDVHILLSNTINGMRVEATTWPRSTFA